MKHRSQETLKSRSRWLQGRLELLGVFSAPHGPLVAILEASSGDHRASWGGLGGFLCRLGNLEGRLGIVLRGLGIVLGVFCGHPGMSWKPLGPSSGCFGTVFGCVGSILCLIPCMMPFIRGVVSDLVSETRSTHSENSLKSIGKITFFSFHDF